MPDSSLYVQKPQRFLYSTQRGHRNRAFLRSLSMDTSVSSTSLSSHVDVDSPGHFTRTGRSWLRASLSMDTSVSSTSLSSHVDVDSPGGSTRTGRSGLRVSLSMDTSISSTSLSSHVDEDRPE